MTGRVIGIALGVAIIVLLFPIARAMYDLPETIAELRAQQHEISVIVARIDRKMNEAIEPSSLPPTR